MKLYWNVLWVLKSVNNPDQGIRAEQFSTIYCSWPTFASNVNVQYNFWTKYDAHILHILKPGEVYLWAVSFVTAVLIHG